MGSFKEYYMDVKKHHKKLSSKEEKDVISGLSDSRFNLKEAIFSVEGMYQVIANKIKQTKSIAAISDDFNSNKLGNNLEIENNVKLYVEQGTKEALHRCNFRLDWLFDCLKEVELEDSDKNAVDFFKEKVEEYEQKLILSCLKTAVKLALNYRGQLAHEDAVQIANMALVQAVKKFNPAVGVKFVTYAHQKIRFRLKQELMEDPFGIVHIPRSAEVEEGTGSWLSLEEDVEDNHRSLADLIPDGSDPIDTTVEKSLTREKLKEIVSYHLNEEEAEIITKRFLSADKVLTYQEVRERLTRPLTRERIRQIEEVALTTLKSKEGFTEILSTFEV